MSAKPARPRKPARPGRAAPPAAAPPPPAPPAASRTVTLLGAAALAALALLLHARGVLLPFLGEDFTFLDAAIRRPFGALLVEAPAQGGAFRPLARELHAWLFGRVIGFDAGGFHLVNLIVLGVVLFLFHRVIARAYGARLAWLAAGVLACFPPLSVAVAWASRVQELAALAWALGALLAVQLGRPAWWSGVAAAAATLSWEGGAATPLVLEAWRRFGPPGARRDANAVVPAAIGAGIALVLGLTVRSGWPADVPAAWRPAGLVEAWRLPVDLVAAWWPPDAATGIGSALHQGAPWVLLVAAVGALVAFAGRRAPAAAATVPAAKAADGAPWRLGLVWLAAGALPVALLNENWRGTSFLLAAPGACLAIAALLARAPSWAPPVTLAALAALCTSVEGVVPRPVDTPPRHDLTLNYARVRVEAERTDILLSRLAVWCGAIASEPATFVSGMPRGDTYDFLFGPGVSVACRQAANVRPLDQMTASEAARPFGLLRFDPAQLAFVHEPGDARVRRLMSEGFVVRGRHDVAVSLLRRAVEEGAGPEARYLLAATLAAAGDSSGAVAVQRASAAGGRWPRPDSLAVLLLAGLPPARIDSAFATTAGLASAVLSAPTAAAPHSALGRLLLGLGRPRTAALELAIAWSRERRAPDLAALAEAYEGIGAIEEARAAYQLALSMGLPPGAYDRARIRFLRLEEAARARGAPPGAAPFGTAPPGGVAPPGTTPR